MRNQDILTLINHEREATINFGRITGVKKNASIAPASPEEVAFFKRKKRSFDPVTGLNLYGDERLIRAREAMLLAVTIFNSGNYRFKPRDIFILKNARDNTLKYFQITNVRRVTVAEHVSGQDAEFRKGELERQLKTKLTDSDVLNIFEFKPTYDWRIERMKAQEDTSSGNDA
jgi:hypothetical protein